LEDKNIPRMADDLLLRNKFLRSVNKFSALIRGQSRGGIKRALTQGGDL